MFCITPSHHLQRQIIAVSIKFELYFSEKATNSGYIQHCHMTCLNYSNFNTFALVSTSVVPTCICVGHVRTEEEFPAQCELKYTSKIRLKCHPFGT